MSKVSNVQIKDDEKKFMIALLKNSGDNIENIGKKIGFDKQKTLRINRRLKKNIKIWGYCAVPDLKFMGFKHFIVLIKRTSNPLSK